MSGNVVRARSLVAASLVVFVGAVLQSCSDSATNPRQEFNTRMPLASISTSFSQFQFLGEVTDDGGVNDVPAQSDLNAFTRADNVPDTIGVK